MGAEPTGAVSSDLNLFIPNVSLPGQKKSLPPDIVWRLCSGGGTTILKRRANMKTSLQTTSGGSSRRSH